MAVVGLLACLIPVVPSVITDWYTIPSVPALGAIVFLVILITTPRIGREHRKVIKENQHFLADAYHAGDSAGFAQALRNLGIAHTEADDLTTGLDYAAQSFTVHRRTGGDVTHDLRLLAHQRELMGDSRFFRTLHRMAGEATAEDVVRLLKGSEHHE
ncbi:hypothetical protein [Streptosporangium sp. NPDC020145]|uniref:hypothetical protein n=1 Tax=Streptosporangium sp. NPDC020145 TaxID=3154694 RepID=UPI00343D5980